MKWWRSARSAVMSCGTRNNETRRLVIQIASRSEKSAEQSVSYTRDTYMLLKNYTHTHTHGLVNVHKKQKGRFISILSLPLVLSLCLGLSQYIFTKRTQATEMQVHSRLFSLGSLHSLTISHTHTHIHTYTHTQSLTHSLFLYLSRPLACSHSHSSLSTYRA
jgi:hypothetical protein